MCYCVGTNVLLGYVTVFVPLFLYGLCVTLVLYLSSLVFLVN